MKTMNKQKGLSFLGLMTVLALISFFAMLVLKITPLYMEQASISKALDDLIGVPNMGKLGKRAMIKRVDGQFNIDDVEVIVGKDLIFKRGAKAWTVTADYEARAGLVKNVFVVVHFVKTVEVPRKSVGL